MLRKAKKIHKKQIDTEPIAPELNEDKTSAKSVGHQHKSVNVSRRANVRSLSLFIIIIVVAIIIAYGLRIFVFQQYQVDGPSMQPTLQNGNRLIVWEAPRTWSRITGHPYIPKRGDIVIFTEHNLYGLGTSTSEQLIKRVIGLPGDRIVIKNGVITIYDKQHPKGFRPDATLPYGKVIGTTAGNIDEVIPPNQIFVCGDNRSDSYDSRDFGTVPVKDIIGQLIVRITPLNEIEKF